MYNIGIDTGNRCIKTASTSFVAGLVSSPTPMGFDKRVIKYNNTYYALTSERVPYLYDKTSTDDYFVPTLFGVMTELKQRGIPITDAPIPIHLGVGLPPSHLALLRNGFANYFKRGVVRFKYERQSVAISIETVDVFAQGYSAVSLFYKDIKQFDQVYVIDIGGYTTDVIALNKGMIDASCYDSFEYGIIHLYNEIKRIISKTKGVNINESQIEKMLTTNTDIVPGAGILPIVQSAAEEYIEKLIRKVKENHIDLTFQKGIFVGGGSASLERFIKESKLIQNEPYFLTDVCNNARG